MSIVTSVTPVTEEAESIPWLKVFGDVDLSGVKGKAKSGVKVGTKYHIGVLLILKIR